MSIRIKPLLICFLTWSFGTIGFAQDTLTLAFGSCNKTNLDQSYWSVIDQQKIDAWVWLGDIVYADSGDPKVIKSKYKKLLKDRSYAAFRKNNKIFGVWDDHDYGENDGDKDFEIKKESRDLLYKFLKLPKTNTAWSRAGAYQAHVIENRGITVKLILLDVRYFRDKLEPHPNAKIRYRADSAANILGEEQWMWLERALKSSHEDLIVIGSGTQVIPEEHAYEKWADYPAERQRLFDLLERYSNKNMVLISGDRHMAEASAFAVNSELFLFEITSSGLTHSWTGPKPAEPNGYRIRDLHPVKNFGLLHLYKQAAQIHVTAELKSIDGKTLDRYEIYPQ